MENIVLKLKELQALIKQADKALRGNSNDAEHDALYSIRERLVEFSQDPNRRKIFTFTEEEIRVLLRGLTFALDMGEENYFAFYPDADDYSDGDQDKDEAARVVAQSLRERLGS